MPDQKRKTDLMSMLRRRKRGIALVIGNSAYDTQTGVLTAPKFDAQSMERVLLDMKFEVHMDLDLGKKGIETLFETFVKDLQDKHADTAVFYYSGHGLVIGNINYLVPVDVAAHGQLVGLQELIREIEKCTQTRLFFLDACREMTTLKGLTEVLQRQQDGAGDEKSKRISIGDAQVPLKPKAGLAKIETETGTFIAFAAAPGGFAYEGKGTHSKFTAGLLEHIETADLPLQTLMIRVRNVVLEASQGQQKTWDRSSLMAPFFFNPSSLLWLVGNAIGLVALLFSLAPYSVSLKFNANLSPTLVAVALAGGALIVFLAGLQRAYRSLRRGEADAVPNDPRKAFKVPWRQGLTGGFFGGLITAPFVVVPYILSWGPSPETVLSRAIATEYTLLTVACVAIAIALGLLSLTCAGYFEHLAARRGYLRGLSRSAIVLFGAILGGLLAGIIMGPLVAAFFHIPGLTPSRPPIEPSAILFGALGAPAVIAFVAVNYSLSKARIKKLVWSAFIVVVSTLAAACIAYLLWKMLSIFFPAFFGLIRRLQDIDTYWGQAGAGFLIGGIVGPFLGFVIGLTHLGAEQHEDKLASQRHD